jgi:hypothetical protein
MLPPHSTIGYNVRSIFLSVLSVFFLCSLNKHEKAPSFAEKKQLFNEELFLYLQQEQKTPSWQLSYNIANTFTQVGEYGYAIAYYLRALKEAPRNKSVQANLQVALQKASFSPEVFHFTLSKKETTACILILFSILFVYAAIRKSFRGLFCGFFATCALFILAAFVWQEYISPPVAVIVTSTAPRMGPGVEFEVLPDAVGIAGQRVEALGLRHNEFQKESWLFVKFPSGAKGYIPLKSALLI